MDNSILHAAKSIAVCSIKHYINITSVICFKYPHIQKKAVQYLLVNNFFLPLV